MDFAVLSPEFNFQSFCKSECPQCLNSMMDLGGGCCSQLDERFTAIQTMPKYAERSSTPATLPVIPLLVCFLFLCFICQTMPFRDKHFNFLCISPVSVVMQVPPQQSIYALPQCKCWCETAKLSCYFTVFKHPAHKYSSITAIPKRDPVTAAKFVQIHLKKVLRLSSLSHSLTFINHCLVQAVFYILNYSVLPW